jgi:anti-anti-sigma factor
MPTPDVDLVPFFDAFLSYASADRDLVEPIAQRLADDQLDVFLDSWFIQPGHSIPKVLLTALRKSHKVLVLMTPRYFQSKWTEFELNWNFVETHLASAGARPRVIPVLLQACKIPEEIATLKRIDLTGTRADAEFRALTAVLAPPSFSLESSLVPPGPPSRYLGDFVAVKLRRFCGFSARRAHEFNVVYGELVHNAFAHVVASDNRVEVSVRADPNQVILEVSDGGTGVDLSAHVDAPGRAASSEALPAPGGLRLVAALCEGLPNDLRDGRHVVRAVLRRERMLALGSLADLPAGPGASEISTWLTGRREAHARFTDPAGRYDYVVIATPRIDHYEVEAFSLLLRPHLAVGPGRKLVIDLHDVDYISSAGLRVLMLPHLEARAAGGAIELVCGPMVAEILDLSRFTTVMRIYRSRREAVQALAES